GGRRAADSGAADTGAPGRPGRPVPHPGPAGTARLPSGRGNARDGLLSGDPPALGGRYAAIVRTGEGMGKAAEKKATHPTILRPGDYREWARSGVPPDSWDYIEGGSGEELTLAANEAAFARVPIVPRSMVDVSRVDPGLTLLGDALATPVGVAPMAYH